MTRHLTELAGELRRGICDEDEVIGVNQGGEQAGATTIPLTCNGDPSACCRVTQPTLKRINEHPNQFLN